MLSKLNSAIKIMELGGWQGLVDESARKLGLSLRRRPLSMLLPQESRWAKRTIRDHYTGAGAIVDLGCWLGASTLALVRGLDLGRHPGVVHAFDRFVWEEWMDALVGGSRLAGRYQAGESFRADFERQVRRRRSRIQVHAGDLLEQTWNGAPIEFLFIDVMKSWPLASRVAQQFFPCLIPGVSVIQHQDFVHHWTSWIPLLAYRFRDYFQPVCHIAGSPSMIFRCVRSVPAEAIEGRYGFDSFSADEFEAAYAWAEELVEPTLRDRIRLARIMAFVHQGLIIRAGMELMQEKDEGRLADSWALRQVQKVLLI